MLLTLSTFFTPLASQKRLLEAVLDFQAAFEDVEFCCREGVKRSFGGVREDGVDNEAVLGRGSLFLIQYLQCKSFLDCSDCSESKSLKQSISMGIGSSSYSI